MRALRLAGAAESLRARIRRPMLLAEQPIQRRWLEPARRAVGSTPASTAWADGASMPLQEVIADAHELVAET